MNFELSGWKRSLCIGAVTGVMVVIGWFAPVSIYNAIKIAIASSSSIYLTQKGYILSRDMFNHAIYGYGRNPSSNINNNLISKLKSSSVIKDMVAQQIQKANKSKKSLFNTGWLTCEFKTGDLYYCLQHTNVKITGTKSGSKWEITVQLKNTYDFTEFSRTVKYGLSIGNMANDLGFIMQKVKMLYPYDISVSYTYTY